MLYKVANVITGAGPEASSQDEGASLTSVLPTPQLRVELALLVLLCTDAMRGDLIATFDPDKTHESTSSTGPLPKPPTANKSPPQDLISFDAPEDEVAMVTERARAARQQEVQSTQMQGLRRSALTFFDKWRAGVMHRVCDVLCVRGEVVRQAKTKRKQRMDEAQRQKQGNSLLIDFGGDPFEAKPSKHGKKHGHYNIIDSQLLGFEEPKKVLILHCILLLLLSLENYPAHSRVLLLHLASSLEIEVDELAEHEKAIAQGLLASAASQMDAEESAKRQAANDSAARKWKVGLAAVGGAVLIGVTGGLAAPLLAAGVGSILGGIGLGATVVSGYLGALAGSSVLVGSLFGAYGAKMSKKLMKQYAREVQDFEFIPIQDPDQKTSQHAEEWSEDQEARDPKKREQHRLRVSIGISGWLNSPSDVNKPWEVIDPHGTEPFALRFELDAMLRLGNSLNDVLFSYAWDGVAYTVVSRTLLGALYAGLWPLGLVKVASVLDNPFSVALARADKAGKVLAHALIDRVQGERPVTLTGYSIGARVIYACLVELAEQHAFGLIESIVLMGAPVPSDSRSWRQIRSVVSARVVNVYSTEDYILGFLYRSAKLQMGVAGLQQVKDVHGIENVDMSKLVNGHDRYRYLVGTILTKVGLGDVDFHKVAEQERALEVMERKKEQVRKHVKKHKEDTHQPDPSTKGTSELIVVQDNTAKIKNGGSLSAWDVGDSAWEVDDSTSAPTQSATVESQLKSSSAALGHSASLPAQKPTVTMSHSNQQPRRKFPSSQTHSSEPALLDMDPLSGIIPAQPQKPDFPIDSLTNRQIPVNMVPTPPAPPQPISRRSSSSSGASKALMRDFDTQKYSPPMEQRLRTSPPTPAPASAPTSIKSNDAAKMGEAVAVTTVAVMAVGVEDVEASDDEVSSEFGELSMVEPVPLADGDFGSM
ncbi:DUF726-domain-containing protein [Lojkania enalia]|uniref:DUF726-domain-containing protein n=1 Tax=Lojkania enalia TaxID=147567 RepID=A0A9P4K1P6_9PLEO|nr:DUF726-domain-containing protein [Didymosphaeria enalia]